MNRETNQGGMARLLPACILAILLAFFSPVILLTELMSLLAVISVPAVCTMLLYRWAGRGPAMLSCLLQLVFAAQMLNAAFMWIALFAVVLPLLILMRSDAKPFFERMRFALISFCGGVVAAVLILYFTYGGNMIQRVMSLLPEGLRSVPADALQMPVKALSGVLGRELTVEGFYTLFDEMIEGMIPHYQMNLPGLLFSGAIITAVLTTSLGSRMAVRSSKAEPDSHVVLKDWFLPGSTTGGVLTMAVAAYILYAAGMEQGQTLYYTVYSIALTVFGIQALASLARLLGTGKMKPAVQTVILTFFAVFALLDASRELSLYLALYGCLSALFGRRGVLRLHMRRKNKE